MDKKSKSSKICGQDAKNNTLMVRGRKISLRMLQISNFGVFKMLPFNNKGK
jgi:hypothetical protein